MARNQSTPEQQSVRVLKVGERVRHILSELLARGEAHDDTLRAMAAAIYASVFFDDVTMCFERAERRRTREYRRAVGAAQQALAAASRVRERQRRQLPLL